MLRADPLPALEAVQPRHAGFRHQGGTPAHREGSTALARMASGIEPTFIPALVPNSPPGRIIAAPPTLEFVIDPQRGESFA